MPERHPNTSVLPGACFCSLNVEQFKLFEECLKNKSKRGKIEKKWGGGREKSFRDGLVGARPHWGCQYQLENFLLPLRVATNSVWGSCHRYTR